MATDAPDGRTNAYVVSGRRADHVTPKAPRVRAPHVKATIAPSGDTEAEAEPVKGGPVKAAAKPTKKA